ncbi:hypothetical protein GCM10007304_04130 [Rhodococcoides trifolii]|uniref:DUF2339 domain-containing protein n=2 Tax=Rhodococcoides trifolii TaxID=908250 RepID=A0A917FMX8_9NOCA|nr:hypothetical protein GCM10007304_04130 [Rhodococcus trifolii]
MVSRILAVAGAGVTLVGVVMLLVLAINAGWFGAVPRVAGGAGLCAALVVAGHRMISRPGGRVGAIALAATGFAGLYLDVAAVTVIYDWIAPVIGAIVGLGVAALGIGVALAWKSERLAVIVTIGAAVLAPVVTGEFSLTLLVFLFVLQVAAAPVDIDRDWPMLRAARTVPVVGALFLATFAASFHSAGLAERAQLLALAVAVLAVAVSSSLVVLRRHADVVSLAVLATTWLPVLGIATLFEPRIAASIDGAVIIAAGAVAYCARRVDAPVHTVLVMIASLAALQACSQVSVDSLRTIALLAIAVALMVAAHRSASVAAWWTGSAFGVIGAFDLSVSTPVEALIDRTFSDELSWGSVVASLTLVCFAAAATLSSTVVDALRPLREQIVIVASLVGLYGVSAAAVSFGVLLGDDRSGFVAGHCVSTVIWMAGAAVLLLRGLSSRDHAHALLTSGLLLAGAATAKLFLFDLVALDGIARAAAFLIVGVMLLATGTRYARAFAERPTPVTTDADAPATR